MRCPGLICTCFVRDGRISVTSMIGQSVVCGHSISDCRALSAIIVSPNDIECVYLSPAVRSEERREEEGERREDGGVRWLWIAAISRPLPEYIYIRANLR